MVRTVAALLVAGLVAIPLSAQPTIGFEENSVVARGATPGGSVVWFGIMRDRPGWTNRVSRRDALVADSDNDGIVRLDLGRPVAPQSIWAAVDLASGAFVVATPDGMPRREVALSGSSLPLSARGLVARIQDARQFLEILVVRPGQGAWTVSVGDGGASDDDRQADGIVQVALSSMRPVAASQAVPEQLLPGDVVVLVDPRLMEFSATTFAKPR